MIRMFLKPPRIHDLARMANMAEIGFDEDTLELVLYQTLLNREEMAYAQDLGDYYGIPVLVRGVELI